MSTERVRLGTVAVDRRFRFYRPELGADFVGLVVGHGSMANGLPFVLVRSPDGYAEIRWNPDVMVEILP